MTDSIFATNSTTSVDIGALIVCVMASLALVGAGVLVPETTEFTRTPTCTFLAAPSTSRRAMRGSRAPP